MNAVVVTGISVLAIVLPVVPVRAGEVWVPDQYPTIQQAIDAAAEGDHVVLKPGLYQGKGNRNLSFKGKHIIVRGSTGPGASIIDCQGLGRAFSFTEGEQYDSILRDVTIRDGFSNFNGGGIYCGRGSSPSIYNCVVEKCESAGSGGGIACTEGSNPSIVSCDIGSNSAVSDGGGVYCYKSSPVFEDCVIHDNETDSTGGGMACYAGSDPYMKWCIVVDNEAKKGVGGGIMLKNSSPTLTYCGVGSNRAVQGGGLTCHSGSPVIDHCVFLQNTASDAGGGIFFALKSAPSVSDSYIALNSAQLGAGVACEQKASPVIEGCYILGNSTANPVNSLNFGPFGDGGGMYCGYGSQAQLIDSYVLYNISKNDGAGLYCWNVGDVIITGCLIGRNISVSGDGGGVYIDSLGPGSKIYPTIERSVIWGNYCLGLGGLSARGGGIGSVYGGGVILNSVISVNYAKDDGGGMYFGVNAGGAPLVRNSTFRNNLTNQGANELFCHNWDSKDSGVFVRNSIFWNEWTDGPLILVKSSGGQVLDIDYSDIGGGVGGDPGLTDYGPHNFDIDPQFLDDWHIDGATSPCVNAGDSSPVAPDETDIDGEPRIMGKAVEVGADEVLGILDWKDYTEVDSGKIDADPLLMGSLFEEIDSVPPADSDERGSDPRSDPRGGADNSSRHIRLAPDVRIVEEIIGRYYTIEFIARIIPSRLHRLLLPAEEISPQRRAGSLERTTRR